MQHDIDILHHVGLIESQLEPAVARYEQLGFTFTPLSMPRIALQPDTEPVTLGAGNRCAIFERNYLEILGVVDKPQWDSISKAQRGPFDIDEPLKRYAGLHVMHFGTHDLEEVRERFKRQGTPSSDIARFQRNVETSDGKRTMHAQTLHFPKGDNPEALIQIAQHLTPELVLQPRYMHHKNGAKALTECIICSTNPAELTAKYERYAGHQSIQRGSFSVVDLGYSRILIVAPEHLGEIIPGIVPPTLPFLAGFTVATENLGATRKILTENHIAFQEHGERVIVRPEDACGSAVLFEKEH